MMKRLIQPALCLILCPLLVAQQAATPTVTAGAPQSYTLAPATAAPRSVDSHDENVDAALEIDAFVLSHSEAHVLFIRCLKSMKLDPCAPASALRQNLNIRCALVPRNPYGRRSADIAVL